MVPILSSSVHLLTFLLLLVLVVNCCSLLPTNSSPNDLCRPSTTSPDTFPSRGPTKRLLSSRSLSKNNNSTSADKTESKYNKTKMITTSLVDRVLSPIRHQITELIPGRSTHSVLDVGCGTGDQLLRLQLQNKIKRTNTIARV